jgi:hypothetical protein
MSQVESGAVPRFPIGSLPKRRRRLPNPLQEGAGKGIRRFVTGIHRYFGDALRVPVGQRVFSNLMEERRRANLRRR